MNPEPELSAAEEASPIPRSAFDQKVAYAIFSAIFAVTTYLLMPKGGPLIFPLYICALLACCCLICLIANDLIINWRAGRNAKRIRMLLASASSPALQEGDQRWDYFEQFDKLSRVQKKKKALEAYAARGDAESLQKLLFEIDTKKLKVEPHTLISALEQAAINRHMDCVRMLASHLDENCLWQSLDFALKDACRHGDADGVRFYLDLGCDPFFGRRNEYGALCAAVASNNVACIRLILDARKARIQQGSTKDIDWDQPLIWAAKFGTVTTIQYLLENGFLANIDDFERDTGHPKITPSNPLLDAAYSEWESGTENLFTLITAGADIHAKDCRGATALHLASSRNFPARVQALLEAGADPNNRDLQGGTPLHWAAEANRIGNVKLLRQFGADLDAPDIDGTSAHAVAKRKNRQKVLNYLLQWAEEQADSRQCHQQTNALVGPGDS